MSLVLSRERHLKWRALDPLETVLSLGCGASIIGFSVSVLLDVVTREIGHPWLWLQQLTTGCFVYGIFIGMALAARRNEHMYLSEIVQSMHGTKRRAVEVFGRVVVLAVAACLVVFGWQNFLLDLGSYRMPSLIPLGYYTIIVPVAGALIGLFQVEQIVNGLKHGFDREVELIPEGIE
jgi:TRAP-type C4-dicarboxylate transport system permease small subunit